MVRGMRHALPLAAALAALPVAGTAADRRYSVADFDRVVVEGPYVVRLVAGRASAATAHGSVDALDRISVDVQGQTLRIRRNRNAWAGTPRGPEGPVVVELSTRMLRAARLVGPARLEIDRAEGLRVEFTVEGGGELRARNVDADNLSVALIGSGRIELAGSARSARADIQGTGSLDAAALTAEAATVSSTTSGSVTIAAGRSATVNANGLGDVAILGTPACTVRGIGAAQVRCGSDQR